MDNKLNAMNIVIEYLRNGLQSNEWPVDSKIPSEHELCQKLNVSRSNVRNALSQLNTLGVLKNVHGKGTFVRSTNLSVLGLGQTSHELLEKALPFFEFRRMLEPEICYYAANKASENDLDILNFTLQMMIQYNDQPLKRVSYDTQFHLQLAKLTQNPYAFNTLSNILLENHLLLQSVSESVGSYNGIYYHSLIIKDLKDRNAKKARSSMYEHLDKTICELSNKL